MKGRLSTGGIDRARPAMGGPILTHDQNECGIGMYRTKPPSLCRGAVFPEKTRSALRGLERRKQG